MKTVPINEENRFSKFVRSRDSDDYRELEAWRDWFLKRGIPAALVSRKSGYAVYRENLIEIEGDDEENEK